ncbi:MAG: hypothetical protein HKN78_06850 [Sphingomonadaceae bacterium]|nr:hypothetical protein [Sphingomonadaceae bacterium]
MTLRPLLAGFAVLCLSAVPTAAQAPAGALSSIQTGLWQLRALSGASQGGTRSICVRNPGQLLQLGHGMQNCQRRVLSDSGNEISVRYECRGSDWGQTSVRVETPRLANIDTQGIRGGGPFHSRYEARRTGSCS